MTVNIHVPGLAYAASAVACALLVISGQQWFGLLMLATGVFVELALGFMRKVEGQ